MDKKTMIIVAASVAAGVALWHFVGPKVMARIASAKAASANKEVQP